jgi:hypothetical protein
MHSKAEQLNRETIAPYSCIIGKLPDDVCCLQGMTCSTFQALPPQNRSAEDAAMLHIAR